MMDLNKLPRMAATGRQPERGDLPRRPAAGRLTQNEIMGRVSSLPVLSSAITKLVQVARNERSTIRDLEEVIRTDPGLAANLLRLANASFFGCPRKVISIGHAIQLLGRERLVEVALSASFSQVIPGHLNGYGIDAAVFWSHCAAVGILAQTLSQETGIRHNETAYVSGLLHDIGKLVISSFLSEASTELDGALKDADLVFIEAEREILGVDHARVGSMVADHWQLPHSIAVITAWHHQPSSIPEAELQDLTDLIHLADCLAHTLGFGADIGELARTSDRQAIARLGLRAQHLEHAAVVCQSLIAEMSQLIRP